MVPEPVTRPRPRLYLDIDGVINGWGAGLRWPETREAAVPFAGGEVSFVLVWAPALIEGLEALRRDFDLEIVFLTTWNEEDSARRNVAAAVGGLAGARMLPLTPEALAPYNDSGWWKAQQLLADQKTSPSPYIWADDVEVGEHGDAVRLDHYGNPHPFLHLQPVTYFGLTPEHLVQMREFLNTLPRGRA